MTKMLEGLTWYNIAFQSRKELDPLNSPQSSGTPERAEGRCQIQDLLARGMIEPDNGVWNSLVVLVQKKINHGTSLLTIES